MSQKEKEIYKKPTGNITFSDERMNTLPLRLETKQENLLQLLLNFVVDISNQSK
jgi:hypothetical protein